MGEKPIIKILVIIIYGRYKLILIKKATQSLTPKSMPPTNDEHAKLKAQAARPTTAIAKIKGKCRKLQPTRSLLGY